MTLAATKYFDPRTCSLVDETAGPVSNGRNTPLGDYYDTAASVLIAKPDAGKTIAFEAEAARQDGVYETVRNFLRLDKPEWRGMTLFLNGLDESRAGDASQRWGKTEPTLDWTHPNPTGGPATQTRHRTP